MKKSSAPAKAARVVWAESAIELEISRGSTWYHDIILTLLIGSYGIGGGSVRRVCLTNFGASLINSATLNGREPGSRPLLYILPLDVPSPRSAIMPVPCVATPTTLICNFLRRAPSRPANCRRLTRAWITGDGSSYEGFESVARMLCGPLTGGYEDGKKKHKKWPPHLARHVSG